jgi:hypothetical protein
MPASELFSTSGFKNSLSRPRRSAPGGQGLSRLTLPPGIESPLNWAFYKYGKLYVIEPDFSIDFGWLGTTFFPHYFRHVKWFLMKPSFPR